jgi:hypothetical protein
MKKIKILGLALCLVLGLVVSAQAVVSWSPVFINIGGETIIPEFKATAHGYELASQNWSSTGWSLSFGASINLDPYIQYNLSVTNFGLAPLPVGIGIGPFGIAPIGAASLYADNAGSLITSPIDNASLVTPLGQPLIQMNFTESNVWGVNPGVLGVLPPPFVNPFGFVFAAAAGGPNTIFGESVSFLLSPLDGLAMNGTCSINVVPLPGALVLFGSGLLSLVGIRRRKN